MLYLHAIAIKQNMISYTLDNNTHLIAQTLLQVASSEDCRSS